MGKLIDADALIEALSINPEMCPGCPEPEWIQEMSDLFETPEEAVVRCKDCKYFGETWMLRRGAEEKVYTCQWWGSVGADPNGYCSHGRRKT